MDSTLNQTDAPLERAAPPFWLCKPGYSLIVSTNPMSVLWLEATIKQQAGLPLDLMVTHDPMCAYPLPEIGEYASDQPLARQVDNLKWFGHPIFWLKGDILRPHLFTDLVPPPGMPAERTEMDIEITLRLALQLETLSLYRPADGTWFDITERLSIDVDDPFDIARIREWQNGEPDAEFDSFDLGAEILEMFSINDAALSVQDLIGNALLTSSVVGAYALVKDAEQALDSYVQSEVSAYTILTSDLGYIYAHPLMSDEQADRWIEQSQHITALSDQGEIPLEQASALLSDMLAVLNGLINDNDDVIDESFEIIEEIRAVIASGVKESESEAGE